MSVDKREALKIEAAKRRTSAQGMIEDGLSLLLGSHGRAAVAKKEAQKVDAVPMVLINFWEHPQTEFEIHLRNTVAVHLGLPEIKRKKVK